MSLNLIDASKTKSHVDSKGVVWWENPSINVKINSKGEVYRKTKPEGETYKKAQACGNGKLYTVNIKGANNSSVPYPFSSLFSRMVMGKSLGTNSIVLKNTDKGFLPDNVEIVCAHQFRKGVKNVVELLNKGIQKPSESLYSIYETTDVYITEDFAEFPTKELAEWHQTNVDKGKSNAQVVLDYNGGYQLAEQIFLQEVTYNVKKPYVHFVDVMNNNNGFQSKPSEKYALFDKQELLRFDIDKHTEYTEDEAKSISNIVTSIMCLEDKLQKLV